ncbi:ankyrin repeat domain-containing protein SOWAHC [Rhinatrema bivittatum]|uniref:ankyrin repeat domain-containing protein SOWAHC n=1 Tax=Rhinatrema bivittatum TaxID=194408 RepID=UPI00112E5D53|nr:ankyrin repeat domain-containing protein SOWAHC [Rhinatrema bivittatum]
MAEELSQDAVLRFLRERGGRAPNHELVEHFRGRLGAAPGAEERAAARQRFKDIVNRLGSVRQEDGVKYVCLRKRYLGEPPPPPGTQACPAPAAPEQVPSISVTEASPLPEEERRPVFERTEDGGGDGGGGDPQPAEEEEVAAGAGSLPPREKSKLGAAEVEDGGGGAPAPQPPGGEGGRESARRCLPARASLSAEDSGGDGSPADSPCSPGGLTTTTPRSSRKTFRERMISSSPQLRRTFFPGARGGGGDSDTASLASAEENGGSGGGSVTLDPLEHAWMLSASDGKWESLEGLLGCDPALFAKRDFVTGFNCLHWAAKHGRHELLALLVGFARKHRLPVAINARASGGYTALHLAAMHGHLEVVKLLVGAYDADVDVRDYSGRKACQYLSRDAAEGMKGLVGALADPESRGGGVSSLGSGRWRLSRVLPATITVHRLPLLGDDHPDGPWPKSREVSRKLSGGSSRVKPRLNKMRFRTQIIHTTPSFRDSEEEERALKSPIKLRPKSNVFG